MLLTGQFLLKFVSVPSERAILFLNFACASEKIGKTKGLFVVRCLFKAH